LKFNDKLAYASLLGLIMADSLVPQIEVLPDVIVPVPLHRVRLRERGYNQALELSRPIAKALGVPIDIKHCNRLRSTSIQSLLPANERQKNVKGAFEFNNERKFSSVAIVDDVMTTGHTINELTKAILQSGVAEVFVWVCARAPLR
jgi:ComF family protein